MQRALTCIAPLLAGMWPAHRRSVRLAGLRTSEADRHSVRDFYDALAGDEWQRLARDLPGRVSFEVHRRFLARFVRLGQRALEVGAEPGRFRVIELEDSPGRVASSRNSSTAQSAGICLWSAHEPGWAVKPATRSVRTSCWVIGIRRSTT
jgi:hypothetical protein